jgi:hypothetical protein
MSDLIAWLRGCLDDDERRIAAYRDGHPGPCLNYEGQDPADHTPYDTCYLHIQTAKATPYRDVEFGLAEVDAKRRILDDCEEYVVSGTEAATDGLAGRTLLALAQPYAGRPGWQEEWRV